MQCNSVTNSVLHSVTGTKVFHYIATSGLLADLTQHVAGQDATEPHCQIVDTSVKQTELHTLLCCSRLV